MFFIFFTNILKIIVFLFCSIKISRIFVKEITTKTIEIMTATFTKNVLKGSYKSLFRASIGETLVVEKETKNSVQLTKNGVTKWIEKYNVELK